MERRDQLRNVAFGGAWSEQIAGNEALRLALRMLEMAAARTVDEDLRMDHQLAAALDLVAVHHPKGRELKATWGRVLNHPQQDVRCVELRRLAALFSAATKARYSSG